MKSIIKYELLETRPHQFLLKLDTVTMHKQQVTGYFPHAQ